MADDELATSDASAAAALAQADSPALAFRIALDAAHDRKGLLRIAAWTTDVVSDRLANLREWLQYQWPFLTELDLVELWAGNDEKLTDMIWPIRLLSCAAIPAAIAAELCLRAASVSHSNYALGFACFALWVIVFMASLRLGVPWFYKRKLASMSEADAVAIIHARLVKGAAKYPERVPLLLKLQHRYFGRLLTEQAETAARA